MNVFSLFLFANVDGFCCVVEEISGRCIALKEGLESGIYSHRIKADARTSPVWNIFHEIFNDEDELEMHFVYCTKCHAIKYTRNATTTQLLRHDCVVEMIPGTSSGIKVDRIDFENMKNAAAKFVSLDLRPFNAVECPGFYEIVMAGVKLGQKYPNLTKDDLLSNFPRRKAIKDMVAKDATESKNYMKSLLRKAIEQGGLGCTADLWTDKYKHNSYMAMTANFYEVQNDKIEQRRFTFYMGNITEIVKTKSLIKSKIIEVFRDFGINEQEIKTCVVFTTDRSVNLFILHQYRRLATHI